MNPTNKPLSIVLNGKRRSLHFNLNTFEKFEEVSGKHFLEFLSDMQEALALSAQTAAVKLNAKSSQAQIQKAAEESGRASLLFLKKLSIKDIRAFFYAALHEYDSNDEPIWTLTVGQMGKLVTMENIPDMVKLVMQGHAQNAPGKEDHVEGGEKDNVRPIDAGSSTPANGGAASGPSDDEILASMTVE